MDIVEAKNAVVQERHNHSDGCIAVKVFRRTPKIKIYHANEASGFAVFGKGLGHIFGRNDGNEFGVLLRGERPHKLLLAYDFVRVHSFMIYLDLIEYKIYGDKRIHS